MSLLKRLEIPPNTDAFGQVTDYVPVIVLETLPEQDLILY
jgi:hypothetical protein